MPSDQTHLAPLLHDAAGRACAYLAHLPSRPVVPFPGAIAELATLDQSLPEAPSDPAAVLATLDTVVGAATIASAGPRYFGFVTGGALPAALAANWLAGAWDQNGAFWATSPAAAGIEQIALRWIREALNLPSSCGGAFVTGATMANLTGLAAARHAILAREGWDVEAHGMIGAPPITVIAGAEAHPSLIRALILLGFGRDRVVRVPADEQGRMRAEAIPPIDGPTIVCAQAGNVNSGASDPFEAICSIAHQAGAWVHVDGAFGLWAAAAPERAGLVHGIDQADSWATDGHKWLNVPYDSGIALVRDPAHLRAALAMSAAYLPTDDTRREPAHYTPEMSRRARGIEIWAALASLGRAGLADLIERNCRYAARFAEGLAEAGYAIMNEVVLNQVLVAFGDDATTQRVIAAVQDDGTCWCGGTVWHGRGAMRISVSSWATTESDVDRSLAAILRVARSQRS